MTARHDTRLGCSFAALAVAGLFGLGFATVHTGEWDAMNRTELGPYVAVDGDTIRTGRKPNIRLARIDTPEMPGHCRRGRRCAPGDPHAAKAALQGLLSHGPLLCWDVEIDRYGRRVAECEVDGVNLSDAMLATGHAVEYRHAN